MTFFRLIHDISSGLQSSPEEDMYTMPFLEKKGKILCIQTKMIPRGFQTVRGHAHNVIPRKERGTFEYSKKKKCKGSRPGLRAEEDLYTMPFLETKGKLLSNQ